MQQIQAQSSTPQPPKHKRLSRNMIIAIACVVAFIIAVFWIAVVIGWIPSLLGISPTNLALIVSALLTVLGVLFGFIQNLSNDKNDNVPEVIPAPGPPNIIINVPPYQPGPVASSSQPTTDPLPVPIPPPSLIYRGMAQPPSTNPKTIQQRTNAVKEVYEKLTQPDISSVVLVGIGGQGKSTLAALVYNYVEQQRKEGNGPFKRETLWLRVEENATFLTVAENIFTALDNKPAGFEQLPPQSQAYVLFNTLNTLDPPLLIVLDQFENLLNLDTGEALTLETGEFLDALNSSSCSTRILLTSRPRPRGIRMTIYDSLALYPVSDLSIAEGQALLKSRGVTNATEKDLQLAVERCNGHSLSLCLLASLLEENKLSLSTLLNDPAYKQLWDKNVAEKLLAEIYKHLNDNQRELLHALSIYREAVSRDAIQALISDATKAQLYTLLKTLQAQQLVQVVEGDRRQLHPIVATYTQNYDEQFNKENTLLDHGKAAHHYGEQAEQKYPPRDERKRITDVQPLIEAVWQFCQAEQWQEAYKLMSEEDLFGYIRLWGENVILLEIGQNLLGGKHLLKALQLADVHHQLGWIYDDLGEKEDALTNYQKALFIRQKEGNQAKEGATLVGLGRVYHSLGQKQEALMYYDQALTIKREVGDREGEGTTLNNLGRVYDDLGQKQEALKYYEQALAISRQVGDRGGEGVTLHNIGTIYYDKQRFNVALSCFILAKRIFVEVQSPSSEIVQKWIDDLHQEIGDQQFTPLLQNVEPHAQQIVDDALREIHT